MPPSRSRSAPSSPVRRIILTPPQEEPLEPTPTPSPTKHDVEEEPLFLSIDSGVKKLRAAVLDKELNLVWVEEVDFDKELPEYGTLNGSYTIGDEITSPSEMRIKGLDLLLEKLARYCPDPNLFGRVRAISGAAQQHAAYYLSLHFPSLLSSMPSNPSSRLSSILPSELAFSLQVPSNSQDWSTTAQCRHLELSVANNSPLVDTFKDLRKEGARIMAERTGSKAWSRFTASQIMKVGELCCRTEHSPGVLDVTRKICLESNFLASLFLGWIAPIDVAEACSTNLYNIQQGDWDDEILGIVMHDPVGTRAEGGASESGAARLKKMLGPVEIDGGKALGKISSYFVQRYGFHPDCIVTPFSGDTSSTFLSFQLQPRDVLLCLSVGDTDTGLVHSPYYIPDPNRHMMIHPAMSPDDIFAGKHSYIAMIAGKDAGVGRSLIRDLYCSSEWDLFGRFTAIVPHGGTIGIDNKYFSFFFPHGESSPAQGLIRFICGARVSEFPDRKANPRLLLESQFMSYRIHLSRIFTAINSRSPPPPRHPPSPVNPRIGFDPTSRLVLPSRAIIFGAPTQNLAVVGLLSTILGCDAYVSEETEASGGKKTTSSALGAGYKAAWAWARNRNDDRRGIGDFVREIRNSRADSVGDKGKGKSSTSGSGSSSSTMPLLSEGGPTKVSRVMAPRRTDDIGNLLDPNVFTPAEPVGNGLWLVAQPEEHEFRFYGGMIEEYLRLGGYVTRGLL